MKTQIRQKEMFCCALEKYLLLAALALTPSMAFGASAVSFSQLIESVEAYDFVEVVARVDKPDARNPFLDASLSGFFAKADGSDRRSVDGFCDSADGSAFRIRFMPSAPGDYIYSATYRQGASVTMHTGAFKATAGHRRGPIRVDPKYPWHFVWEGTGEHYFLNGTTAFWLMGWRDDHVIEYSIERLARPKVNRIRALLARAANIYWGEPVMT